MRLQPAISIMPTRRLATRTFFFIDDIPSFHFNRSVRSVHQYYYTKLVRRGKGFILASCESLIILNTYHFAAKMVTEHMETV
jgi:hypothetical protein